jgi:hypothetical protein
MKNISILFLTFLLFICCETNNNPIVGYNDPEIQSKLLGRWYSPKGEQYVFNQDNFYLVQFMIFPNPVQMQNDTINTAIEGNYAVDQHILSFSSLHIISYDVTSFNSNIVSNPTIHLKSRIPYFESDSILRFEYVDIFQGKDYRREIWNEWKKNEWVVYYDREKKQEYSGLREYTYNFTTNKNNDGFYICEVSYINHFEHPHTASRTYQVLFEYISPNDIIISNTDIVVTYENRRMIWKYPGLSEPYYRLKI